MQIKKLILAIGLSCPLMAGVASADVASNPKIDSYVLKQFDAKAKNNSGTVLVVLKEQSDLSAADLMPSREAKLRYVYDELRNKALNSQKSLVDFLKSRKASFRQFYINNMIAVHHPSRQLIDELARRADVARIMGNPEVKLKLPQANLKTGDARHLAGPEESLEHMGATKFWSAYNVRGEGIVVAGQDTGVQWNHPALKKQYRGYDSSGKVQHDYHWHDAIHASSHASKSSGVCGYDASAPCDDQGHGTHTMGTMVGDDGHGNQIGVAPKAQWIACKNMDQGFGSPASYIECFEFFLAPYPIGGNSLTDGDPSMAPHIINNSWGCTREEGCYGDEVLPALKVMKKAGILVVASAGNEGPGCATIEAPPAWHSGLSLSVGAINHRNNNIAYFSSRGPSVLDGGVGPNIAAPGVNIRSSVPGSKYRGGWSGTSMAGPHVAGAAALLWSYNKELIGQLEKTISLFESSATPKTSYKNCGGLPGTHIPNNTYGSGILNVVRAASFK